MSVGTSSGGMSGPWQRGQSGQPSPEPLTRTTAPRTIKRKVATTAANTRGGTRRANNGARRLVGVIVCLLIRTLHQELGRHRLHQEVKHLQRIGQPRQRWQRPQDRPPQEKRGQQENPV